jgi:hypothetical protein
MLRALTWRHNQLGHLTVMISDGLFSKYIDCKFRPGSSYLPKPPAKLLNKPDTPCWCEPIYQEFKDFRLGLNEISKRIGRELRPPFFLSPVKILLTKHNT